MPILPVRQGIEPCRTRKHKQGFGDDIELSAWGELLLLLALQLPK
jgi:hypothetical protein